MRGFSSTLDAPSMLGRHPASSLLAASTEIREWGGDAASTRDLLINAGPGTPTSCVLVLLVSSVIA
ncbi:hypothetical protein F751_1465 [Auxenochlorella protothecoides]|uniref:Uncharacterized protein n=1 Tax=Auxenochlorella protothecoides TaxID=3075 RepID=A0A087SJE7_AUXPR|nr:hypothetical protein F751_1465 [Auxenochlorella protothecoides]KFM25851.1 hypothetical protein F751_1465 [Auxenochlorella protothecoides]